jgi:hypothetical protein
MVYSGRDETINFLVVEEFLVFASGLDLVSRDFLGQRVTPVVQICRCNALDAGKCYRSGQQIRALHADTDNAEAKRVACRGFPTIWDARVAEHDPRHGHGNAGSSDTGMKKLPP